MRGALAGWRSAAAARGSLPRWRDTTRSSPRMPRGRSSRMAQSATPIMTICSAAARACWPAGNRSATSAGRAGPDAPHQHRAEDGAAIVAGAADDQHRPDLEGQHRHVIVRRDEADEMRLHRAGQPHDAAADGEGLQPESRRVLAERERRRLVLADRPQHAAPRAARQPLQREVERDDDDGRARARLSRLNSSGSPASAAKGRGMKPMPNGPPVTGSSVERDRAARRPRRRRWRWPDSRLAAGSSARRSRNDDECRRQRAADPADDDRQVEAAEAGRRSSGVVSSAET